jgi:hypothetical protein
VIDTLTGISDSRFDVISLKIWHLVENLGMAQPVANQIKHIRHADAHPADARAASALPGIDRDAAEQGVHVRTLSAEGLEINR